MPKKHSFPTVESGFLADVGRLVHTRYLSGGNYGNFCIDSLGGNIDYHGELGSVAVQKQRLVFDFGHDECFEAGILRFEYRTSIADHIQGNCLVVQA